MMSLDLEVGTGLSQGDGGHICSPGRDEPCAFYSSSLLLQDTEETSTQMVGLGDLFQPT